jgi:hypothetical protein
MRLDGMTFTTLLDERTVCRTSALGRYSDLTPSNRFGVESTPRVEVQP